MITNGQRIAWVFDGSIDYIGLEQFATSIAALANGEARPIEVLENVLSSIAENLNASTTEPHYSPETVMSEKAHELGFQDMELFREEACRLIAHSMIDLELSKLSAKHRSYN